MTLRAFLARLAKHRVALIASGLLLLLGALAPAASVWLLRDALVLLQGGETARLAWVAAGFVSVYLAQSAASLTRTALTKHVSGEIASELRRDLHAAWLSRPAESFVGERLAGLLDEVDQVQYGVSAIVTALRNPLTLLLLLGTAIGLSPRLAALSVLLFSPAIAAGWWSQGRLRRLAALARQQRAILWHLAAEQLSGLDVLRAFGAVRSERDRFRSADDADRSARLALEIARVAPSSLVEVLAACALGGLLLFGSNEVAAGRADAPTLVAFVVAGLLVHRPASGLAEVQTLLTRSLTALQRVDAVLAMPVLVRGGDARPRPPLPLCWEQITVSFGDRRVLDAFSATALPGEMTALVGRSGAGKTTLLSLAMGKLRPTSGCVRLGDVPLDTVAPDALPDLVAVVPQDSTLFSRTVLDNLALGTDRLDRDRAVAALRAAGAEFVLTWPDSIDTRLEENGRGLSGGERSRLCLARALYREAPILLLDEPTAQLDEVTSTALVETLCALRDGRTIVIATHDPIVWQRVDRVIALASGDGGDQSGKEGSHSQPSKGFSMASSINVSPVISTKT